MRKKEQGIQDLLDALVTRSTRDRDVMDRDSNMDIGGQIRGVAAALAILRGTSAMKETMKSDKRVEGVR